MAENDIYNNKAKFEYFQNNYERLLTDEYLNYTIKKGSKRKYFCKNKINLKYYPILFNYFALKDLSYVRRNRLIDIFNFIVYCADKDLKELDRNNINNIVGLMHSKNKSPKSKETFIKGIKNIWKILFPETDDKGRIDETIIPYVVRHLSAKIDKSKEKRRNDRLKYDEFERLVNYFSNDKRIQFYLMLALESLGRPQEILYLKISDIEMYDNYAKLWISEHGKEGVGFLRCIDSFPYLIKWLEIHPFKDNKNSFLFINLGRTNFGKQLTPFNINKKLKIACKDLGIDKPITCYSLKRSGVTLKRIMGESDLEIQHTARWTSTKQLKTYDLSDQEDAFKIALVKKGLLKDDKFKEYEPKTKNCMYCNAINGFSDVFCVKCKRPLDRKTIEEKYKAKEIEYTNLKKELQEIKEKYKKSLETEIKALKILSKDSIKKVFKTLNKLENEINLLKNK